MIEPFQIVSLEAGKGRIGLCRLPGRSGDLAGDLAVIKVWKPAIVVSLTEASEIETLGAAGLATGLKAAGIAWRHCPVLDYGVPDRDVMQQWPALSQELHQALESGHNILLHCRGGIGRSGMVALRLMVEQGEAADVALKRLRAIRPGAVETAEQERWAALSLYPG